MGKVAQDLIGGMILITNSCKLRTEKVHLSMVVNLGYLA